MKNDIKFKRKSIRLPGFDYAEGNWFYVTLCTYRHNLLFGKILNGKMYLNNFGKIVYKEWNNTKQIRDNVELDYYVIMPNHFHGILIITHKSENQQEHGRGESQYNTLNNKCRGTGHRAEITNDNKENGRGVSQYAPTEGFKSPSQTLGAIIRGFKGSVTKQINELRGMPGKPVWQRNYYERVIRNEKELFNIRNYILNNPHKWELDKGTPENLEL